MMEFMVITRETKRCSGSWRARSERPRAFAEPIATFRQSLKGAGGYIAASNLHLLKGVQDTRRMRGDHMS